MEYTRLTGLGQIAVTSGSRLKAPSIYALQILLALASRSVKGFELAPSLLSHSAGVPQTPPS